MFAKQLMLAATIALVATSGYAIEATPFEPQKSTLSRADVKAELARAQADGSFADRRETYGAATPATSGVRDRAEVRAEARAAVRSHAFNALYVGS
jgi:Domain of unknown function (DUF4148)